MISILARAFSQTTGAQADAEEPKIVAIFCVAGLVLSLLVTMAFGPGSRPDLF